MRLHVWSVYKDEADNPHHQNCRWETRTMNMFMCPLRMSSLITPHTFKYFHFSTELYAFVYNGGWCEFIRYKRGEKKDINKWKDLIILLLRYTVLHGAGDTSTQLYWSRTLRVRAKMGVESKLVSRKVGSSVHVYANVTLTSLKKRIDIWG